MASLLFIPNKNYTPHYEKTITFSSEKTSLLHKLNFHTKKDDIKQKS